MELQKKLRDLESRIYKKYYELNPDGDARFGVWGKVIDANKQDDPLAALEHVLDNLTEE